MSIVTKPDHVLTFGNGRYREQVTSFLNKKSIGFRAPIYARHLQLFSRDSLGVYDAALEAINIDLDISCSSISSGLDGFHAQNIKIFKSNIREKHNIVFAVTIGIPEWFEPVGKKLSINNLEWMPKDSRPNNIDDFDPWSREVFSSVFN